MLEKKPDPPKVVPDPPPPDHPAISEALAKAFVKRPVQAAWTLQAYLPEDFYYAAPGDTAELTRALESQVARVNGGALGEMEGLLVTQAYTLNSLFHELARRAQGRQYIDHFDRFLKLALRAQNQCRATIETLATVKNPPNVAFVKQANVAQVQQVNNHAPTATATADPLLVTDSLPQLEQLSDNYLDTETTATASGADPAMATLGEIHRPEDHQG